MKSIGDAINLGIEKHLVVALATIVKVKGSVPQSLGAKMLVSPEGRYWGTIGGGILEHKVITLSKDAIINKNSKLKIFTLEDDEEKENSIGMLCGGEVEVFIDVIGSLTQAYIFGGGHISQELSPILRKLGFTVNIIENRKEYAKKEIIDADSFTVCKLPQEIVDINFLPNSFIFIITYSHSLDESVLKTILSHKEHNWTYLGMIGSKAKVKEIFSRVESQGIDPEVLKKIYSPIGLPIGSHSPLEIAISISAEVIKVINKKRREN